MKSENGGVFFCKKVDLSSTQGALCTVSVFFILHFTYLGGGVGAYAPNAPTLPTGLEREVTYITLHYCGCVTRP